MARQSTSTDPRAGDADSQSKATGALNRSLLEHGRLYDAIVTEVTGTSYEVIVSGSQHRIAQCRWGLGIFLGLAGFRTSGRLSIGDKVVVLYGHPSYIIQGLPRDAPDENNSRSRTNTGYGVDKLFPENTQGVSHSFPNDLLEGEFEIANLLGAALVFSTNLITMKAGDRAKVEVSMINDMVRLVSQEYRHHSALGDDMIYDDGRLNAESNYTYFAHEAHGQLHKGDPLGVLENNQFEPESSTVDAENDTGIWRASFFKGWVGDFLHWFISDPQKAVATIGAADQGRSGRSRIWAGSDGSVLVQSVADIVLERVVRVQVPTRKKRHDDPSGNVAKDFDTLNAEHLKAWRDSDPEKPWERAFQLRQYARWLSQNRSFARFKAASKDWDIAEIGDIDLPSATQGDFEVAKADPSAVEWKDAYATIRIYRDGSIGAQDTEGSSLVMAHGSIWLSAARHLNLEAAGDIRLIAGQNVVVKARRSIDLVAVTGGIIAKSRTWWKALCEQGSIWIKSDAVDPAKTDPPDHAADDPKPEVLPHAVVLQASRGKVMIKSKRSIYVKCEGPADDPSGATDQSASIMLESVAQHVIVKATKAFNVFSDTVGLDASYFVAKVPKVFWPLATLFDVSGAVVIRQGVINTRRLHSQSIKSNSIDSNPVGPMPAEDAAPTGVPQHFNHVRVVEKDYAPELTSADERHEMITKSPGSTPVWLAPPQQFKLLPSSEYYWDTEESNNRYVSPTQQTLTMVYATVTGGLGGIAEWDWSNAGKEKLKEAPETDSSSAPFGFDQNFNTHENASATDGSGMLLNKAESTPDVKNSASGWTSVPMKFIYRFNE